DLPALDRLEHLRRLEALTLHHVWRMPKAANTIDLVRGKAHMCGKLIGQPANLTASHGVGLSGERKRAHARPANAAGGKMTVDDAGDLVSALRRLVHALRKTGHDVCRCAEQFEEARNVGFRQSGRSRGRLHVGCDLSRAHKRVSKS